jgi:hypothetical protein
VMQGGPNGQVTREDVEQKLGEAVDRKRWTKVDDYVSLHPHIEIARGDKNRVLYKRRT